MLTIIILMKTLLNSALLHRSYLHLIKEKSLPFLFEVRLFFYVCTGVIQNQILLDYMHLYLYLFDLM